MSFGGGYFGQDYFGGSPSTPAGSEGGRTKTLVFHLDVGVAVTGTATQPTDALIVARSTNVFTATRLTNALLVSRSTNAVLPSRSTNAVLPTRSTDTTDFDWEVSP